MSCRPSDLTSQIKTPCYTSMISIQQHSTTSHSQQQHAGRTTATNATFGTVMGNTRANHGAGQQRPFTASGRVSMSTDHSDGRRRGTAASPAYPLDPTNAFADPGETGGRASHDSRLPGTTVPPRLASLDSDTASFSHPSPVGRRCRRERRCPDPAPVILWCGVMCCEDWQVSGYECPRESDKSVRTDADLTMKTHASISMVVGSKDSSTFTEEIHNS